MKLYRYHKSNRNIIRQHNRQFIKYSCLQYLYQLKERNELHNKLRNYKGTSLAFNVNSATFGHKASHVVNKILIVISLLSHDGKDIMKWLFTNFSYEINHYPEQQVTGKEPCNM
jgi:hypothetical protein